MAAPTNRTLVPVNVIIRYACMLAGAAIIVSLLSACSLVRHTLEHASYETLMEQDDFELRYYDSMVLITSTIPESDEEGSAFRRLFAYISGENSREADISMTAPVFMDIKKSQKMSFVLPQAYELNAAPLPNDSDVVLEEIKALTVATIRFNGRLTEENIAQQKARLVSWVEENQFEVKGPAMVAGYDPPSSLPMFRRNEILLPIEKRVF